MVVLHLLLLLLPSLSSAVIPAPCASNVTQTPAICCPVPAGHKDPCGYPHRGRCALVTGGRASRPRKSFEEKDIRTDWPARIFQYVCKCAGRYWGISCEGCRFGFEGSRCQHRVVNVRRNVMKYTPRQKRQFMAVLNMAHHVDSGFVRPGRLGKKANVQFTPSSIYENAVYTHYFASFFPTHLKNSKCKHLDLNHDTDTFILWHRYILLWWERQLRDMAREKLGLQNFTFPYWDYTNKNSCEVCTADFVCPLGKRDANYQIPKSCKPLSTWKMFCTGHWTVDVEGNCDFCLLDPKKRRLQRHLEKQKNVKAQFITAEEFRIALEAPTFAADASKWKCGSFSNYIESGCTCLKARGSGAQMHNLVHNMFGGTMQDTVGSPNDPLFFLHHSQLDRLFHRWVLKAKPTASQIRKETIKAQVCRECNLVGFLPTVTGPDMLRDLTALGVNYDSLDFGPLKEEEKVPLAKSPAQFQNALCHGVKA